MKLFLLKILIATGLFALLNFGYLFIIKKKDPSFFKSIEAYQMKNQKYQCLVFGNSCAMDGIDTKFLTDKGVESYNFSLGGTSLMTNFIQFEHYLKENSKPTLIIIGFSPGSDYHFNPNEVHPVIESLYQKNKKLSYKDLPMIKFRWIGKELFKNVFSKDHRNVKIEMGQYKSTRTVHDHSEYDSTSQISLENYLIKFQRSIYLSKFDSLCRINNIDLILLELPGSKKNQNILITEPIAFENMNGKQFNIINLNNYHLCKKIIDGDKDWLAEDHLNMFGALKITKHIYNQILKRHQELKNET